MIFQKVYQIEFAKMFKGVKILDLCDPDWLDNAPIVEMIQEVDAVTTSTEPLAEFIRMMTDKPVICIPDRIKFEEMIPSRKGHRGKAKNVVWFGYGQNHKYLDQTIDVLHEGGYSLTVISNVPFQPNFTYNYKVTNIEFNYATFNSDFIKHDVAILPPVEDMKGLYKSNNKDLISWALGLPVAKVPEDLEKLNTAEARNKQVEEKGKLLHKEYDIALSAKQYQDIIKRVG